MHLEVGSILYIRDNQSVGRLRRAAVLISELESGELRVVPLIRPNKKLQPDSKIVEINSHALKRISTLRLDCVAACSKAYTIRHSDIETALGLLPKEIFGKILYLTENE